MKNRFEIYKDKSGEFFVRYVEDKVVSFVTSGYASKSTAMNAIRSIKNNGPNAPVVDTTITPTIDQTEKQGLVFTDEMKRNFRENLGISASRHRESPGILFIALTLFYGDVIEFEVDEDTIMTFPRHEEEE